MSAATKTISRRSVLGAMAAAAALPTSATMAPAGADPVFGLIEQHRIARRAYDDARAAADRLRQLLPDDVCRGPRVQIGWRPRSGLRVPTFAYSHGDISEAVAGLSANFLDLSVREWKRAKHAALQVDVSRQRARQERAGLTAARNAEKVADDAEVAAIDALYAATATTLAGLLAFRTYMLDYERKYYAEFEPDPTYPLDRAVQRSLEGLLQV